MAELELLLPLGVELLELGLELELGELELPLGLALEPEAALPVVLPELAPPPAWSFFESIEPDAEPLALDGDEVELDGEDGEVVEPADDEVEPEGEVVVPREAARSPFLSHAVSSVAPRATDTASAIDVILMWPPWLGYLIRQQGSGPPYGSSHYLVV